MHVARRADRPITNAMVWHGQATRSFIQLVCGLFACGQSSSCAKSARYTHVFRKRAWTAPALLLFFGALVATGFTHAQTFAAGGYHTCAVTQAGGTVCWGANSEGQLGDNSTITRAKPVNVVNLPFGVTSITGGHGTIGHTCVVTAAGGVKCWGANAFGQLGENFNTANCATTTTRCLAPVDVSGMGSGIARVTAGSQFSCALGTTGGVSCWGINNNGQLGNGTAGSGTQPLAVGVTGFPAMAGATYLASGFSHSCVVTATGGVKCWGANFANELGDNSDHAPDFFSATPVEVVVGGLPFTGAVSLSAGSDHTCALTSAGGVKCWGDNFFGEVGDGSAAFTVPTPVDVVGLTSGVAAIVSGKYHTCALTTTGAVKCWGDNSEGQLGDGTDTQRNTPVDTIASGVFAIAAGDSHTCAQFSGGASSCWGTNVNGQMGNGSVGGVSYTPTPTQYPAATVTTVASSANPSIFGDSVIFTATVTGGIDGTAVTFQKAGSNIAGCISQLLASGTATCTVNNFASGAQSITAIYAGTSTTLASTSAAFSQVVNKADQVITFDSLADKVDNDPPFTVTASVSSGLASVFTTLTPAACTVSGSQVSLVAAGTCTIAANQAGTSNYNAAPQVTRSFTVISSGPALALTAVQSRKTHVGAGVFDIPVDTSVPISGAVSVECRAIGTGHTIVFQFNIPITSTGTVSSVDSAAAAIGSASAAISGSDVVVTLTGIPDNKRVTISLSGVNGTALNVSAPIGFLVGDVNNSRSVNASDISGVRARSLQTTTAANFRFDVNASGSINASDISAARARSLLVLP